MNDIGGEENTSMGGASVFHQGGLDNISEEESFVKKVFSTKTLSVVVIIAVVMIVGWMGYAWYTSREIAKPTLSPTSDIVIEEEPTVEPTESYEREEYSIRILNGSGEPGLAGGLQKILEENDFSVIGVGNAVRYTYEKTEIRKKNTVAEGYVTDLTNILSESYEIVDGEKLPSDSEADIEIIIGRQ